MAFFAVALLAIGVLWAGAAPAHEVRPGYLEIRQADAETYEVLWKVPARGDMRLGIYARLPESCEEVRPASGDKAGGRSDWSLAVESSRSSLGRAVVTMAGCAFLAFGGYARESRFEVPPVLEAATYLDAGVLKGDHHVVRDEVVNDGFMNTYTVDSAFGEFEAYGEPLLAIRLREVGALAELDELSKTKVFADAVATGALAQVETVMTFAEKPVETVKGVPGGVKRMFKRTKRTVKKGAESAKELVNDDDEEGADGDASAEDDKQSTLEKGLDGADGRGNVVEQAAAAESQDEGLFFLQALHMLAGFKATGAEITELVGAGRLPGVVTRGNRLVFLIPVDHIFWTESIAGAADGPFAEVDESNQATIREVWFRGRASPRCRSELEARGWLVRELVRFAASESSSER